MESLRFLLHFSDERTATEACLALGYNSNTVIPIRKLTCKCLSLAWVKVAVQHNYYRRWQANEKLHLCFVICSDSFPFPKLHCVTSSSLRKDPGCVVVFFNRSKVPKAIKNNTVKSPARLPASSAQLSFSWWSGKAREELLTSHIQYQLVPHGKSLDRAKRLTGSLDTE